MRDECTRTLARVEPKLDEEHNDPPFAKDDVLGPALAWPPLASRGYCGLSSYAVGPADGDMRMERSYISHRMEEDRGSRASDCYVGLSECYADVKHTSKRTRAVGRTPRGGTSWPFLVVDEFHNVESIINSQMARGHAQPD